MNGQQNGQRPSSPAGLGYVVDPPTGLYLPAPYLPPEYRLGQPFARLPLVPAGTAFNVAWVHNGPTGTQGLNGNTIVSDPTKGPLWLDGQKKQYTSLVGEFLVINQDTTRSLNIVIAGQPASFTLVTIGPGAVWNESDREINPAVLAFVCATPATSITITVILYAYGSNY